MKTIKLTLVILFFSFVAQGKTQNYNYYTSNGQKKGSCNQFFKLTGIYGEVKFSGFFRQHEISRPDLTDTAQSWMLSAGIALNAGGYFCNPDFFSLNVGVEYSPEQSSDLYLTIPDQGEIRTLKKFDISATFLQNKIVSLTAFANMSQTYSNREYGLTSVRTDSKSFGGVLFLKSRAVPLSISYNQGKIIQDEIENARLYTYENKDLQARINRSFGQWDRHELVLSHSEYNRIERDFQATNTKINEFLLNDDFFFDKKQRVQYHNLVNLADQAGYDSLQRIQVYETIRFKLPAHFELLGGYNYYNVDRRLQDLNQQTFRGMLKHKLFESLYSDIFFENINGKQTSYDQTDTRAGFDLDYEKKIPGGTLNLSYKYLWQRQDNVGNATTLQTMHEAYQLKDGVIVLIKRPYVDQNTVQVWDETGSILYQLNLDYLLIVRGNYLEIQRVPGGQILNNVIVFLNYTSEIPGSYSFDMTNNYWSAGLTMFNKLVNVYYRHQKQDYTQLQNADAVTLDYYTRQVYGVRLEYKVFSGGYEFEDNSSTVFPYELQRVFVMIQGQYNAQWVYNLNGNYSNYLLHLDETRQEYADVSAQVSYILNQRSKINLDGGYRQQVGEGIDLDLLSARLEYSYNAKKFYLTAGVQTYRRDYLEEIDNFRGGYFRIGRRF